MKKVELPYATLSYKAPIVMIVFKDRAEIGLYEIRELVQACEKLSNLRPYYVFADARERVSLTPLGITSSADPNESPFHRGTAVLVNSYFLEKASNIFGKIARLPFPYKVFTNPLEPMPWLYSLRNPDIISSFPDETHENGNGFSWQMGLAV